MNADEFGYAAQLCIERKQLQKLAAELLIDRWGPLLDVSNVLIGDALDFGACHVSATSEPEKRTNLVEDGYKVDAPAPCVRRA